MRIGYKNKPVRRIERFEMEEMHQLDYQKERLLKPNEVAELLNVSRAMSYHLLQSGQIPVVRINRTVRVKPDDLRSFIEQQRITS